MQIEYRTRQLELVCTSIPVAERRYSERMAERIHLRIEQIRAAENIGELLRQRLGRCHALSGDRAGQYAMDLAHPFRLIFIGYGDHLQIAEIQEIVDYH
ncbi:MAG: type II toxin-antitoxin system RelE/ParE family toxin [Victivallales bacterium]|nr:type II toxin-antitoxin system RelE/ParE family toxin [Victivallales bacterium]